MAKPMMINMLVSKCNEQIRLLDSVAEQLEEDGDSVLAQHLDSIIAELNFKKVQMLDHKLDALNRKT